MALLDKIKIEKFRGFDSLEIDGLSKINLFVGKNNSGKTSILEAVFLLLGMSNPALPNNINLFRGLNNATKQIKYLFHNLSYKNKPSFVGNFSDASERWLEVNPKFQKNDFSNDLSSVSTPEISGIELKFSYNERHKTKQSFTSIFDIDTGKISLPKDYHELLKAIFILPDRNDTSVLTRLSEIIKKKEGEKILPLLQNTFDNNILGIYPLTDGIYFNMKDVEEYVPSNILGDGIRRFLNIVTAILEKQNSFIMIDEIENGLHYSAYKNLWKSILSFAKLNEKQLFITTHNIETLECLKSVLEDSQYEDMRDFAKVFSISKTEQSEYKAYKYSYEEFKTAIDNDIELRR
jgi:AAA15 family ATPase/GTPase